MSVLESKLTIDTTGTILGGAGNFRDDETVLQDAGRSIDLATFTVMAKKASDLKLIPLTDINPALTSAKMVCGTNGGNAAAYIAVSDGAFKINVDGTLLDLTGIDFSGITLLIEVEEILNEAADGRFRVLFDRGNDIFTFVSNKQGLPESIVTVLTAGSAGTDISGAGFLNGLTTVGTETAATGEVSASIPIGLFWSNEVLAATIVAGDVTNQKLLVGGDIRLDEDKIILENSLTLASIITATGKTVEQHLQDIGIFPAKTFTNGQIAPV